VQDLVAASSAVDENDASAVAEPKPPLITHRCYSGSVEHSCFTGQQWCQRGENERCCLRSWLTKWQYMRSLLNECLLESRDVLLSDWHFMRENSPTHTDIHVQLRIIRKQICTLLKNCGRFSNAKCRISMRKRRTACTAEVIAANRNRIAYRVRQNYSRLISEKSSFRLRCS
jgi:hypothetical protein